MTDVHLGEKALPLLSEAHRVVRALDASDGPFVGLLVTRGDGVAVQLDAGRLAGWDGWRFAGSEHVAGPLDLVRRSDGHDVLVPWCPETVTAWVGRSLSGGVPLHAGQCVTVAASVLRGIDELGAAAAETRGNWWVTSDGRPVFVFGEGDDPRVGGARVLSAVADGCRDKAMGRLLAAVRLGLEEDLERPGVPPARIEQWERDLFELAAPRPLRGEAGVAGEAVVGGAAVVGGLRGVGGAAVVGGLRGIGGAAGSGRGADAERDTSGAAPETSRRTERAPHWGGVVPHTGAVPRAGAARRPASVAATRRATAPRSRRAARRAAGLSHFREWVAREWFERRDRVQIGRTGRSSQSSLDARGSGEAGRRRRRRPRRRVLVLAAGAAGAVLLLGLLLPDGGSDEASATPDRPVSATDAPAPTAEPPSPRADGEASVGDADPAVAATALLREGDRCRSQTQPTCDELLVDGVADTAALREELGSVGATLPTTQLVDEYGDIAVIRATGSGDDSSPGSPGHQGEWILVLARTDDEWLVRDVYDVADQS